MQNCYTYMIFIDSIKGETSANFVNFYLVFPNIYPRALLFLHFANVFPCKISKNNFVAVVPSF